MCQHTYSTYQCLCEQQLQSLGELQICYLMISKIFKCVTSTGMAYGQLKLNTKRTLQQQEVRILRLKIMVISHKLLRFPMYVFTKPFSITLLTKNSLRNKGLRGGDRAGLGVRRPQARDSRPGSPQFSHLTLWTLVSYHRSAKVKSYKKVGSDNVLARSIVL